MACLTPAILLNFLVWLVIVVAIVALLNLIVPWVLRQLGPPPDAGIILRALQIVVWAVVAIAVVYFVVALFGCLGVPKF